MPCNSGCNFFQQVSTNPLLNYPSSGAGIDDGRLSVEITPNAGCANGPYTYNWFVIDPANPTVVTPLAGNPGSTPGQGQGNMFSLELDDVIGGMAYRLCIYPDGDPSCEYCYAYLIPVLTLNPSVGLGQPIAPSAAPGGTALPLFQPIRGGSAPAATPCAGCGSPPDPNTFQRWCHDVYVREQHLTVIRRGPTMPPKLEMFSWEGVEQNPITGAHDVSGDNNIKLTQDFYSVDVEHNIPGSTTKISNFYTNKLDLKTVGDIVGINIDHTVLDAPDWEVGDEIIISHSYTNSLGVVQTVSFRCVIHSFYANPVAFIPPYIRFKLLSTPFNFPLYLDSSMIFTATAVKKAPIFEYKFPKFAYRYKYDDGEYSVFSPWSEIAFIPKKFDYLPKKGYNLGMTNNLRTLKVKNWRPKNTPKDVVEIDLLYKESNSPNVYTVETFDINSNATDPWNLQGTGNHYGNYTVSSELIHKVVASNQMLRPWDNVPRMALGQEITANRLIYGNYLQNYNLLEPTTSPDKHKYLKPDFSITLETIDHSINSGFYEPNPMNLSLFGAKNQPKFPMKSLKSMRTYQLGVVYRDRYGRETPVLTSKTGSVQIPKSSAKLQSKFAVQLQHDAPDWAESYTFYVKETSNEYYNLSMDRWYDAEDGGIWLSFPSSERNKVSEGSVILLKKQHGNDKSVEADVKYKILDIKNEAPSFIKTDIQYWGSLPMMLPPPGWGVGGKVGGWDTGMFHPSGIPGPDRLYLDIYAEYFDQSVLAGLSSSDGAQVRIVQSPGLANSYTSWSSNSINKSEWYNVDNLNYIGIPETTYTEESVDQFGNIIQIEKEEPGQPEQIVRLVLAKLMGEDTAFCEPSIWSNLSLSTGLSIEARTKTKVDAAKFYGRFFAKIHRDSFADVNIIQPQQKPSEGYQVLMSKKIKYICHGHPGVQDWRTDEAGTWGATRIAAGKPQGKWYQGGVHLNSYLPSISLNYIPVAFDPEINIGGDEHLAYHDGPHFGGKKREVSSFSSTVGQLGTFTGGHPLNVFQHANVSTSSTSGPTLSNESYWPIGPGWNASNVYSPSSLWPLYANAFSNFVYGAGGGSTHPFWPVAAENNHGWPAFAPDHWAPNTTVDTSWAEVGGANDIITPQGGWPDVVGGANNAPNIQKGAKWNAGLEIKDNDKGNTPGLMLQVPPANPHQVPAIWGDQGGFFNAGVSIPSSQTHDANFPTPVDIDLQAGINPGRTNFSLFNSTTIEHLRKQWWHLYYGNNVSNRWPTAWASPERWFFDKVGAAQGYSGNGIWDEGNVSKMHISYYGIGQKDYRHRSHDMQTHQENEVAFADVLSTVGTQFRFKEDPDQTIYSITRVEGPEYIYNYEAPRGTWGQGEWDDTANGGAGAVVPVPGSGNGIGGGLIPPFGPWIEGGQGGIADKQAFISDVFTEIAEDDEDMTGGCRINYRTRFTITLDKIVGGSGYGFHPITNHVDENGDCSIVDGRKEYWSEADGSAPSGWNHPDPPSEDIGGTVLPVRMYNLSSYWNNTNASGPPTTIQSKRAGVGAGVDGMHFGLHEAGLNDTTIEIITPYTDEDIEDTMSTNPAVFETEPKEDVGLDIYYAASPTYPISLERWRSDKLVPDPVDLHWDAPIPGSISIFGETGAYFHDYGWRGEELIPVGAKVVLKNSINGAHFNNSYVVAVQGSTVWLDNVVKHDLSGAIVPVPVDLTNGDELRISWVNEGAFYGGEEDLLYIDVTVDFPFNFHSFKLMPITHSSTHVIPYFNCYSFANGIESNRIRDDYNAVTIDKGVKASMPLAEKYLEERRGSSLIFSGIYNSTSGINRTNQFIQAEPITKEINPINGTIQKLFARDTDLITFCENKVFKILANKDALFSAGGNTNLTSTSKVLGHSVPFSGDYGISKNPESFASESYRAYFADKQRGTIMRLSKDGLTPISKYGMKDWFKDNLMFATSIIGSYDDGKGLYNMSIETKDRDNITQAYTLSYKEEKRGWESFKSWIHQGGVSHKNIYYTFPSNTYYNVNKLDNWGISYASNTSLGGAETFEHNLDLVTKRFPIINYDNTSSIVLSSPFTGVIIKGMNVEGNGIPDGTYVTAVNYNTNLVIFNNNVFVTTTSELKFTMQRNYFYHIPGHYSMLKVLFNGRQGSVKRFKTLNYEGSQARVQIEDSSTPDTYNLYDNLGNVSTQQVYYDNWSKDGWYVEHMSTECQKGRINEFIDKECKWFNYIKGYEDSGKGDAIDTAEFSAQGLGKGQLLQPYTPPIISACCNDAGYPSPLGQASNYSSSCTTTCNTTTTGDYNALWVAQGSNYWDNTTIYPSPSSVSSTPPLFKHNGVIYTPWPHGNSSAQIPLGNEPGNPGLWVDPLNVGMLYWIPASQYFYAGIVTTLDCCEYGGCIDGTQQNFSVYANVDDGSCIATVYGCVDDGINGWPGRPSAAVPGPALNYAPGMIHFSGGSVGCNYYDSMGNVIDESGNVI